MNNNILIVDDEELILEMLKRTLNEHGYNCFLASDAESALTYLQKFDIDLVLLDINMPGKSGVELLHEIRILYENISIVMATANDNFDITLHCLDAGADDYILKPFNTIRVLTSVKNAIEKKKLALKNARYNDMLKKELKTQHDELTISQDMLIKQEKLAAIGQLAAGIAHEINNPLGYVTSNLKSLTGYSEKLKCYTEFLDDHFLKMKDDQLQILRSKKSLLRRICG